MVELIVPLSNSMLFNLSVYSTAKNLCNRFPGLEYTVDEKAKTLTVYGELTEYWQTEFNKAVFEDVGGNYQGLTE